MNVHYIALSYCLVYNLGFETWGPYFFVEENGHIITVNTNRYCQMLEDLVMPKLDEIEDTEKFWFLQVGATCHASRRSIALLREIFPNRNRLISLRGDICMPVRSPELNLCDFFLWGHLQAKVLSQSHETIDDLKDTIRREVALIPPAQSPGKL